MELLLAVAVIFIAVAIFLAFGVRFKDFEKMLETSDAKTIRQQVKRKENRLLKFLQSSEKMLQATGQGGKFSFMIILSVCLIFLGVTISISLNNLFLIPITALAFGISPFIYIRFKYIEYSKFLLEVLSSSMAQITTSYERTENILIAFKENADDAKEPVKSIFLEFINEIENINPNYEKAIDNMKNKINNTVWVEWCEALKRCSRNRTLKYVLSPIVTKFSKVKVVTGELQNILSGASKNFWVLLFAAIALLFAGVYILPQGLMLEIPETLRNALIAVNLLVATICGIKVSFITKQVKFDL